MRTTLTVTLLVALAVPASAQDAIVQPPAASSEQSTDTERDIERARLEHERALERAEHERERALEEAERARERAEEQSQQERQRALEQAERERERAQQERQRALEQAQRERERAAEQAQRERERAAEQRDREREQAQRERERAAEQRARERERAAQQRGGYVQNERIARSVRIGANGELDVANISGDITVTRAAGNEAAIEIIKTARGRSDAEAKELLALVHVDIVERGSRTEVRTRYPEGDEMRRNNRRNMDVSVAINIAAPANTRVRASSISGDVSAKDIRGDVSLESVSGMVRVANSGRVSVAKSLSGDVEIIESDMNGGLEASTASGSILLRRVKAPSLELGSISGSVVLDEVQSARVQAQTISGDVSFGGVVAKNARYALKSHSGNVQLTIAGAGGFELDATSFSGAVRSDFPMTADGSNRRRNSLRGVYGDGSAVLDLTTFSGNIVVSKR
jgi:DUF4097 and DUF4098 domain-containing protein YvlB